jgi:DNA topoisomerase III
MTLISKQTADPGWGGFANTYAFLLPSLTTISLNKTLSLQNGGFATPRRGKNDDKAHPPIHPTAHAANLVGEEKRVYEFIARRFLACCSKDAEGWQTTVEVTCGGEEFSASGM